MPAIDRSNDDCRYDIVFTDGNGMEVTTGLTTTGSGMRVVEAWPGY